MIVLGNNILGNLNKEATSQKSLGLPFWRVVIGSGIVVFSLGFLNIIAVSIHHVHLVFLTRMVGRMLMIHSRRITSFATRAFL